MVSGILSVWLCLWVLSQGGSIIITRALSSLVRNDPQNHIDLRLCSTSLSFSLTLKCNFSTFLLSGKYKALQASSWKEHL